MEMKRTSPAYRLLALILCLAMVLPMLPLAAQAATSTKSSDSLLGDGVVSTGGTFAGSSVNTGNTAISLERVTSDADEVSGLLLYHYDRYAIMNAKYGYLMSYDPVATTERKANLATSILRDENEKAENTYFVDSANSNKIYIDHSTRNNALWILTALGAGAAQEYTRSITVGNRGTGYTTYGRTMQVNGTEGFTLFKGRFGPDNVTTHGYYWYTPAIGTGADAIELDNRKYFTHLNPRSTSYPFGNEQQWEDQYTGKEGNFHIESIHFDDPSKRQGNVEFLIYFKMADNDYRFLYCDEHGNWGVRRYYDPASGVAAGGSYYPMSQIQQDMDMLKVHLYHYSPSTSTVKQVKLTGTSTYTVARGISEKELFAGISQGITVTDTRTNQQIPCNGSTGVPGRYWLDLSAGGFNANRNGTYTIPVKYRNDTQNNASNANTNLGSVTITVASMQTSQTSGVVGYISKNSMFSDKVYTKDANGNYVLLTGTLGGVTVPVSVKMLRDGNQYFDTSMVGTHYGISVTYSGSTVISSMTLVVEESTIPPHMPAYPEPGSVAVFKEGITTQSSFANSGKANIQISATGMPISNGIDLIIMIDLSSSMRYYLEGGEAAGETPEYYSKKHALNTSWTMAEYQKSRLYAMEESLKTLISTMQAANVDVRIAISDFGDIDHYEVGGSVNNAQGGSILVADADRNYGKWAFLDNDGEYLNGNQNNQGWNRNYEMPNHLNYVFGGDDVYAGSTGTGSGPYHIWHWKYWSTEALVNKYSSMSTLMMGKMPTKVYTGSGNYDADAFANVDSMSEGEVNTIVENLRIQNSFMLGTNYDVGLETAYQLAHARREQNIRDGEDRKIVCVFMSDGAAMQYNYFSGYARSYAWADWLTGDADSILTSSVIDINGDNPRFELPTLSNGVIDMSRINEMHPDLQAVIRGLGLQSTYNLTWAELYARIRNSSTSIQMPSDGKSYSGQALLVNLRKQLGKTKKYWDLKHADYLSSGAEYQATVNSYYQTYSPFYYFYNAEGKNWWAEAIKGDIGELYPVINKYAHQREETAAQKQYFENLGRDGDATSDGSSPFLYNGDIEHNFVGANYGNNTAGLALEGQNYISGYDGLGIEIYTIGFALADDWQLTQQVQNTVLKNIATSEAYHMMANNQTELVTAMNSVIDSVTLGATQAYFTDTLGDDYDLCDNSTIKVMNVEYQKNADGSYALNSSGKKIKLSSTTVKTIQISSVANKVATSNGVDIWNNTTNLIDDGDLLLYNANTRGVNKDMNGNGQLNLEEGDIVDGYIKVDLTGDGAPDYALAPETFFWRIGKMPQYEIVLDYWVYLTGSMEGELRNGKDIPYLTNDNAPLHYVDFRANDVTMDTVSPVYYWSEDTYINYNFYLAATAPDGTVKTDESGNVIYLKKVTSGGVTSYVETTILSQAVKLTVKTQALDGVGSVTLTASQLWASLSSSQRAQFELVNPDAMVYIDSAEEKQDHDVTVDDYLVGDATTTFIQLPTGATSEYADNLVNNELESSILYFAMRVRSESSYIQYGNYLVNENGQPIDSNGNPTTIQNAVKVGPVKTQKVNVQMGQGNVSTSMNAETAFNNCELTDSDYRVYNPNASYSVSSSYGANHTLTVNGSTTLTTGGYAGSLTSQQLEGTTVYFPVVLKEAESTVTYGHYLVDDYGNPIGTDGKPTTIENAVKVGKLNSQEITTFSGQGEVFTTMDAQQAFTKGQVDGSVYEIYDLNGGYDITSEYGEKHTLETIGDKTLTTGYAPGDLSDEELAGTVIYFPVKQKKVGASINYGNYLVNENGQPIDQYGNVVDSIEEAYKPGDVSTHDFNVVSGQGKQDTVMDAETAFKDGGLIGSDYEVYDPDGTYTVTSEYGKDHKLSVSYDKILTEGGQPGVLTDEELSGTTVYFPVKVKTEKTIIHFVNYLVNSQGQPLGSDGEPTSIENAVTIGKVGTQTVTLISGQDSVINTMDADTAYLEGGLIGSDYQIFDPYAAYAVISQYGAEHYLNIIGKYTLITGGQAGYLSKEQLSAVTIYFPVSIKKSDSFIQYGNYLVNENGKPIDEFGNVVPSIEEAYKPGIVNTQDLTVESGNGRVYTNMDAATAFENGGLTGSDYEIYSPDGAYTVTSEYGQNHILSITGDKVLTEGGAPGELGDEALESTTVYFPVKVKTQKSYVRYGNYLVNDQGQPIDENGNPTTIENAVKVGDVTKLNVVTLSGQGKVYSTIDADTAYVNGKLTGSAYQIYDPNASFDLTSQYGKKHQLVTNGSTTLTLGGEPGSLSNSNLKKVTVYFPVKLVGKTVKDQVIIDFGIPVSIDVLSNDGLAKGSVLLGISAKDYDGDVLSTGTNPEEYSSTYAFSTVAVDSKGTLSIVDGKVLYTTTTMSWETHEAFTYVVKETVNGVTCYYYGAAEVLPATTIYFEDSNDGENSLITFATYTNNVKDKESDWSSDGYAEESIQHEDRPGVEGHNIYGYDQAYEDMAAYYSLGSAHKVNVYKDHYATATFSFWGTGFDVISMTSNTTGTIVVTVKDSKGNTLTNKLVDTYYGYSYVDGQWVESKDAANALYQVPVMKINALAYDYYTVTITASYISFVDHTTADGYDFYLDAIRIYDPANDGADNVIIEDAYEADGEGWPEYFELRNQIISTGNLDYSDSSTTVNGIVFIDRQEETHSLSVSDYANFGPNSELYLAAGQSIAFNLNVTDNTLSKIHLAMKSVGGDATAKYFRLDKPDEATEMTMGTATDLYYDITDLNGGVVVISNSGDKGIVSITNIKVTYTEKHTDSIEAGFFDAMKIFEMVDNLGDVLGGGSENDDTVVTEGTPKLIGASLALRDEVHVNYYFESSLVKTKTSGNITKATNAGLLLWYSNLKVDKDANGAVTKVYNTYEDAEKIVSGALLENGKFVVQTPGIPAKKLGDTIYARVYVRTESGEYIYSDLKAYSPRTYAYNKLNDSSVKDAKLKNLLVAMLNYATAAQEYFMYNVDIWMPRINADLTQDQLNMISGYKEGTMVNTTIGKVGDVKGLTSGGFEAPVPSVAFDGAFAINYYMKPTNAVKGNVSFYYWTSDDYESSKDDLTLDTATVKTTLINAGEATAYRANVTGISAKDIKDNIYIAAVYSDGTTTYCTGVYAYSISAYCKSMTGSVSVRLANLARATAIYGFYAKEYFG